MTVGPRDIGQPQPRAEFAPEPSRVGPPHLLLLRHAMADYLVHCGLGNAAAYRQPLAVARAIVHERTGFVVDIEVQVAQIPPQLRELIPLSRQQRGIQRFDSGHRFSALAGARLVTRH